MLINVQISVEKVSTMSDANIIYPICQLGVDELGGGDMTFGVISSGNSALECQNNNKIPS